MRALFSSALIIGLLAFAPNAGAQDQNPVVAIVNGDPIYLEDVRQAALSLPAELGQLPFAMVFDRVLDRLIDVRLIAQQGRAEGLASDPEVEARLRGLTDRVIQEVLLTRKVESTITEQGLRQRYQDWLRRNPPGREARVRHILVGSESRANEALARVNGGEAFADVAQELSLGPEAAKGGALGFVNGGTMPAPLVDLALATPDGEVAPRPVQTVFGWHVVKTEAKRNRPTPSFTELRGLLVQDWSNEIIAREVEALRGQAAIDIYDVTPGDRPAGSSLDPRWRAPAPIEGRREGSLVIDPTARPVFADLSGPLRGLVNLGRSMVEQAQLALGEPGVTPRPRLAAPSAAVPDRRAAEGALVDRRATAAPVMLTPEPTPPAPALDRPAAAPRPPQAGVMALARADLFTPEGRRAPQIRPIAVSPRPLAPVNDPGSTVDPFARGETRAPESGAPVIAPRPEAPAAAPRAGGLAPDAPPRGTTPQARPSVIYGEPGPSGVRLAIPGR